MSEPLTFWDHLDELRGTLFRMLGAIVLFGIIAFCLKDELFSIVLAPHSSDFITYRLLNTEDFNIHLMNTGLTEQILSFISFCFIFIGCLEDDFKGFSLFFNELL